MEVRVFVPADDIEKEIANPSVGFWRQTRSVEGQSQFITTVQEHQRIILRLEQLVYRAVTSAPAGGSAHPRRRRLNIIIVRRERQARRQSEEPAKAVPT